MNKLIAAAVANARTVLTALVLIFIAGFYAYATISKEQNPDVPIPFFFVNLIYQGISPEDSERLLVRPVETYLRGIEGLKEIKAISYEGGASIIVEFDAGFNADKALIDVREKVNQAKAKLPQDTEEPVVTEFNASLFPIVSVVLYGDVPERVLVRTARDLREGIENLPGVLSADLAGAREELLEVIIDPVALQSYQISQEELLNVVLRNNRLVPAGALENKQGRFSVKLPGVFEKADDVLNLPVKVSGDGIVRLRDIAEVRRTFQDPQSFARLDGKPSVALDIRKRTGENVIETIDAVRKVVAAQQKQWPGAIKVEFTQDQSVHIRDMMGSLQNNVLSAVILVAISIVATMGARAAGLVGISVPGSFLLGILFLYAFGYTVNQVVMFALIMSVGIIVDGAIIVVEYADRKMADGLKPREAYTLGAQRMVWPVIASTATTLAAFVPLLFWPGIMGSFMKYLPLTMIVVLAASLIVAVIFVPTLGARMGRTSGEGGGALEHLSAGERMDFNALPGFTGWYARTLSKLVERPWRFLGWTAAFCVGVLLLYGLSNPRMVLMPDADPDLVNLQVHARGNLSIYEQDALVRQVEAAVKDIDGVDVLYTRVGGGGGASFGRDQAQDVIGSVTMIFKNWRDRPPVDGMIAEARKRTAHIPGIIVEPLRQQNGPVQGKAIDIDVTATDPSKIAPAVARLRAHMDGMKGLVDIEDSRPLPGIEWQLAIDRAEAGRYGADISTAGNMVQLVTSGVKVGEYRPEDADDEVDIRVRFPETGRTLDQLDQLRVQTAKGSVPLSNFIKREPHQRVSTIERINGNRVLTLRADVAPGENVFEKLQDIQSWISANEKDPNVRFIFRGQDEEQKKAASFLTKAFFGALFIIAIILLAEFNSFYNAALILSAVLLSIIGVIFGIWVTGRDFIVIMTGIGIISLAGVVVSHNIVLIDTFDRLQKAGIPTLEAIVRTGAQRLRPVVLTSVTTVIGLLPSMFGMDIDFIHREVVVNAPTSVFWIDLSIAIGFGLTLATILTLVVTPCLLAVRHHARLRLRTRLVDATEDRAEAAE